MLTTAMEGVIEGEKRKGRRRMKLLDSIKSEGVTKKRKDWVATGSYTHLYRPDRTTQKIVL